MISSPIAGNSPRRIRPIVLDARSISGSRAVPAVSTPRARVLGAVAPQHRLLRGPTAHAQRRSAADSAPAPAVEAHFVSNMEILDALLAAAHDRLLNRLSRLGMRRGQAQRFVVTAAGRLLRAAQHRGNIAEGRLATNAVESVAVRELAIRTRVSDAQAEQGLQVVLAELTAVLADMRR